MRKLTYSFLCKTLFAHLLALLWLLQSAQAQDSLLAYNNLKKLSLEELMDVEVTSVSKHVELLKEVASAIQVITQNDIRNSGVKTLAEALRLAPNLQVAQVNSSQWAISARGFNNVLANKLLVLIDGRTVYTPLYAGVFWDVQNVILENIDRIEVISGPGGTLWGANAVNGVINIITKKSGDTKGLFAEAAAGIGLPALGSLRYGGQLAKNLSYQVYGTGYKMHSTVLTNGADAEDEWAIGQGGLRLDWEVSKDNKVAVLANAYYGEPNPDAGDTTVITKGDNILARWNHVLSGKSDFQLQLYYDHTWRDFGNGFTEKLKTLDLDWQHRNLLGKRHEATYGLNFRFMDHKVTNLALFQFSPGHKKLYLYSLFVQDKIMLVKERLHITLGIKVEHNSYTGFEYQPNGRVAWTPSKNHTVWVAVSRAVRTPARIDRDFYLYLVPTLAIISGNDSFLSEKMIAYEIGWRSRPLKNLSLSLSAFYNEYDNIRSAEPGPPPFGIPIKFANGVKGKTYGVELSATSQVNDWWNLRGGYTFLKKDLSVKSTSKDLNRGKAESNDPVHQFLIQSTMDIPGRIELGTVIRYVDQLPDPRVSGYFGLDMRIGWRLSKVIELNLVGQNLLDNRHPEFIPSSPSPREIERTLYGRIICRL